MRTWMKQSLAVSIIGLGLLGCSSGPSKWSVPLTVPLAFRPTDPVNMSTSTTIMTKSARIVVEDRRDRKDQIGENTEKTTPVAVKASGSAVGITSFVKDAFARSLAASNVAVNDTQADRTIIVSLSRFWVDESDTYKGNVAATIRVLPGNGSGQALWEGQVTGDNTRFGRSLKAENYQESLSDSTVQLINKLLADNGFRSAMK